MVASLDGSELYVFDSTGKHTSTLNSVKGTTKYTFAYDSNGHLITITDAYSNVTTVNRVSGLITGITAPFGQSTTIALTSNYTSSITNPNSEVYHMTYYTGGLIHTFQNPNGVTSTMAYDTSGLLTSDASAAGSSLSYSSSFQTNGFVTTESTALGRTSTHAVTSSGGTYSRIDTDPTNYAYHYSEVPGSSTSIYDSLNYNFSGTNAPDARLGALYNPYASTSTQRGTHTSATSFSQTLAPPSPTSPFTFTSLQNNFTLNGHTSSSVYTSSTSTYATTSAAGATFNRIVDSNERTTSLQLGSFTPFTFAYDTHGRLSTINQGVSRPTTLAYNTAGFLSSITNALSQVLSFAYDASGRVHTQTLPDTRVITYGYDSNGNMTSVTPPGKSAHTQTFNLFDFIASYISPTPVTTTSYTYDNDRKLTKITRPDATTIAINYNATTGLLNSVVIPTGTNSITTLNNKLPSADTSIDGIVTSYGYSGGLITSKETYYNPSDTLYSLFNYTYDTNFNVSNIYIETNHSWGYNIGQTFDADNRLISAGVENLTRDTTTGLVTQTEIASGLGTQKFSYSTGYGELSQIQGLYNTTQEYLESVTRDNLGRVATKTEQYGSGASNTYTYTYDSAGRLTDVMANGTETSHYVYDTNSNRTSQTISGTTITPTYNGIDQIQTFGTKTYTFSTNGYLSSVSDSGFSPAQVTSYTYDALGNLKSVTLPSGTVISYKVDTYNRRVSKAVNGTVQSYYVYDNQNRLTNVFNGSGTAIFQFIYGSSDITPDWITDFNYYYQIYRNHLGSLTAIMNVSNGTLKQQITYDEFGKVLSDTSPGLTPFGFAGCLYDADTGLCHFGGGSVTNAGRDYDAYTGRWLNRDPILFNGGDTNLYGYVLNDPINQTDSNGQCPLCVIGGVIGGAGLAGGFGSAIGTLIAGGTIGQATSSFGTGFIAGAVAGAGALGGALGFIPSAVGIGLGLGLDLGITLGFAPASVPDGTLGEIPAGINPPPLGSQPGAQPIHCP